MVVVKFGGTSVGAVPQIGQATRIVQSLRESNPLVVVSEPVDAREIIVTSEDSEFILVDFEETKKRCQKLSKMAKSGVVPVVTGFICSTPAGITTTLGRGGSDYSASIIGSCIKADE